MRRRVEGVDNAEGKQQIIVELYDKFFATAFKKTVDQLGIVYTPVEIVDFILRSADDVLRAEFGQGLTDEGVHVLDPFTGTGTFIVRLLQSGLIDARRTWPASTRASCTPTRSCCSPTTSPRSTSRPRYAAVANGDGERRTTKPFPGIVLTDTFQSCEDGDRDDLDDLPGEQRAHRAPAQASRSPSSSATRRTRSARTAPTTTTRT